MENPKEIPINLRVNKELDNKYIIPTKFDEQSRYIIMEENSRIENSNFDNKDTYKSQDIEESSSSNSDSENSNKDTNIKEKVLNFLKMQSEQIEDKATKSDNKNSINNIITKAIISLF